MKKATRLARSGLLPLCIQDANPGRLFLGDAETMPELARVGNDGGQAARSRTATWIKGGAALAGTMEIPPTTSRKSGPKAMDSITHSEATAIIQAGLSSGSIKLKSAGSYGDKEMALAAGEADAVYLKSLFTHLIAPSCERR